MATVVMNKYSRTHSGQEDRVPSIKARFFYTSPYALDDPLSPLPPPLVAGSPARLQAPRPFSAFDNGLLEEAWIKSRAPDRHLTPASRQTVSQLESVNERDHEQKPKDIPIVMCPTDYSRRRRAGTLDAPPSPASSISLREGALLHEQTTLTRNPFIRAPSRKDLGQTKSDRSQARPHVQALDSYDWDDDRSAKLSLGKASEASAPVAPVTKIPVGVSRLHSVSIPDLNMEPIYWSPLNDVAPVIRATWFYRDTSLPVESDVANMLESGYVLMQPWTQTWRDELASAVNVGAIGEERILHQLWPEQITSWRSGPDTAPVTGTAMPHELAEENDPENTKQTMLEAALTTIMSAALTTGVDSMSSGVSPFGRDGHTRQYSDAGVLYANAREAYILRPNLQPSAYYKRRPYADYVRKGASVGIGVVRGFEQKIWNKLNPQIQTVSMLKAFQGVSSAEAGVSVEERQKLDGALAMSERPRVTDLVLVIHGIGQKLSERLESYNFTYAMNAFRREVNVELGADSTKSNLRSGMGGIMVLPVNWRLGLSFEDGGYHDGPTDRSANHYTLQDITPETLPSVRGIVSDVMLDIPYYLSQEHNPKMVSACIKEANRIYRLWCANNSGFAEHGKVHILAHSLGSVMAFDILSAQPTYVDERCRDLTVREADLPQDQFWFDTSSLITCGSPAGFFLLLKKSALLPRSGRHKPGFEDIVTNTPGVSAKQGVYGCLAVDNVYNVINGYDPVACKLNAAFDAPYSHSLKLAYLPSAAKSWKMTNPFLRNARDAAEPDKPVMPRLPSNVELETHNFTREEIAEERAYLLNDNGQVDFFMRYGGGPLEIQYLTMLGAHSSYWISRDFIKFVVTEIGRKPGRAGTLPAMRAQKKNKVVV